MCVACGEGVLSECKREVILVIEDICTRYFTKRNSIAAIKVAAEEEDNIAHALECVRAAVEGDACV